MSKVHVTVSIDEDLIEKYRTTNKAVADGRKKSTRIVLSELLAEALRLELERRCIQPRTPEP